MTDHELKALLPEWQQRLRLQDWDVSLKFEKYSEGLGNVRMCAKYKSAEIIIREPAFIDPDELGNKDLEVTLVHELLHVQAGHLTHFLAEKQNDRYYDEMERLVELTALALVKLKRGEAAAWA